MSLQRRLLVYLLVCAPLVWGIAVWVSVNRAQHEVNELFDTELIHLARQVQSTLGTATGGAAAAPGKTGDSGEADLSDLAIVVWDRQGRRLLTDREGALMPYRPEATGFVNAVIEGEAWRVYYLQSFDGQWLVAAGQKAHERDELAFNLTASQLLPWLMVLPLLLGAMTWAVRRALAPVRQLTGELAARGPDDLTPVASAQAPAELAPLVGAMNALLGRIGATLARERRFTADAAHELRTPLAVLRAQWDVVRRSAGAATDRVAAEAKFAAGLDRLDRLVTQLLSLSRLDASRAPVLDACVHWPAVVEQAMSDVLPLAEQRHIDLACEWHGGDGSGDGSRDDSNAGPHRSFPLQGDAQLLTVLLRNLLDNAARYAPPHSQVVLRFACDRLSVENAGPPLAPQVLQRLGERFYRPDGQDETGSGLGVSIAQRIAALHRLVLVYSAGADGQGVVATLQPRDAAVPPARAT